MRVEIIAVGKIKESYWRDAIEEYLKRLQPYAKVTITEVKEVRFRSKDEREAVLDEEGRRLISKVQQGSYIVALDAQGITMNSELFAHELQTWTSTGDTITFIIGGPLGLSEEVKQKARVRLSLSKMTFTHQMARVILLEQIYRAITIQKGKTYHY